MSIFEEAFKKTKKQVLQESSGASPDRKDALAPDPPGAASQGEDTSSAARDGQQAAPACGPADSAVSFPSVLKPMREHLDGIWGNLVLCQGTKPRSLLFCGGTHGEGVTFVSFHLSLFLSIEYGMRVLYVDTGVEKSQKGRDLFDQSGHPGLLAYLLGNQAVESLITKTEYENLFVIPAGGSEARGRASGIIANQESLEVMSSFFGQIFDLVVYDGLPATMYPSVFGFARLVDQVVLVGRYAYSRREVLKLVADKMAENGIAVSGMVLNDRQYPVPTRLYRTI